MELSHYLAQCVGLSEVGRLQDLHVVIDDEQSLEPKLGCDGRECVERVHTSMTE